MDKEQMLEQQLGAVTQARKSEEAARRERHQESSRRRLLTILTRKLNTSFIGALARFETYFGRLWGHRKEESQRTPEERAWYELWQTCRNEILNNGNNQLRAVQSELLQYTVSWDRYHMVLPAAPAAEESES